MKKILSTILTVLCMTAMVCCSNESVVTGNESTTTTTTGINYNLCKMTAETQIMRTAQYDEKWEGAKITNHYYWYNPMIEDAPAYIEFKVTKDGQDAGYVMVSTTEQDFEVPEYSTEGKTMYECLQNQANSTNITATRFNSFDYMAEVNGGRGESKRVFFGDIAYMNNSEGGRGCSDYDEYIAQYKAFRNKIGGIGGCKAELANYYKLKEDASKKEDEEKEEQNRIEAEKQQKVKDVIEWLELTVVDVDAEVKKNYKLPENWDIYEREWNQWYYYIENSEYVVYVPLEKSYPTRVLKISEYKKWTEYNDEPRKDKTDSSTENAGNTTNSGNEVGTESENGTVDINTLVWTIKAQLWLHPAEKQWHRNPTLSTSKADKASCLSTQR